MKAGSSIVKVLYFNAWKLSKGFMRLHVVNKIPGTSMFNRNNFQEGVKGIDLFICPPTMWCHFVVAHQLCGTSDAKRSLSTRSEATDRALQDHATRAGSSSFPLRRLVFSVVEMSRMSRTPHQPDLGVGKVLCPTNSTALRDRKVALHECKLKLNRRKPNHGKLRVVCTLALAFIL